MTDYIRPAQPKDKTAAVLLAVFLGFWTWLYTYERDNKKFWIALSYTIVIVSILAIVTIFSLIARFSEDAAAARAGVSL